MRSCDTVTAPRPAHMKAHGIWAVPHASDNVSRGGARYNDSINAYVAPAVVHMPRKHVDERRTDGVWVASSVAPSPNNNNSEGRRTQWSV